MVESLPMLGSMPDASLFNWLSMSHPPPQPPAPVSSFTMMRPFNIPDSQFLATLDPKVPLTIATLYAVTVKLLNKYNRANGKKAWWISKTRPFFAFVVLHNIFLAVYSAWTFWGMVGTMKRSTLSPFGPGGSAATADHFCRLHGGSGLGNSVFFDDASQTWTSLAEDGGAIVNGVPSSTEPGRIWNEGLAFYGWIFYLSKFYEVLDTFIILAKGKPSSTLQTYHHAGAMMCMWAGIRFMSVPIWVFKYIPYTYYTLTAFSIKIPVAIKRTLTTMQITQFLLGASYAMVHSFISYVVPITITHQVVDTPHPVAAAENVETGALGALKNMVFGNSGATPSGPSPSAPVVGSSVSTETVYVTEPCIKTAGETFAIWLNVLYLAPLTYLFVSFFIASYVKRSNAASKLPGGKASARGAVEPDHVALAEKAGWDAARGVEREIYNGENMVNGHAEEGASKKKSNGKAKA